MNTFNYVAYTKQQDIQPGNIYKHIQDVVGWREQLIFAPIENDTCWRQEFLSALQTLYRTQSDLNILFSGGGDSLMTSMAFLQAGINNIHHTVYVFTDNGHIMHSRELLNGLKHLSQQNLKYTINTVDINEFFEEWTSNEAYAKYTCLELDRALQLFMLARTDSSWFNIVNEPTPSFVLKDSVFYVRHSFDQMLHLEFMKEFAVPGISRIYTHTPRLMSAWYHGQEMQQLMHKDAIGFSRSLPQMATGWNQFKYKLYAELYHMPIMQYKIPKSTIQMWDNKKYLLKWHQLMDEGKLPRRAINPVMEIPYEHLWLSWVNETDAWFDHKDYGIDATDGPWHTQQGIKSGNNPFPGQSSVQ